MIMGYPVYTCDTCGKELLMGGFSLADLEQMKFFCDSNACPANYLATHGGKIRASRVKVEDLARLVKSEED